MLAGTGRSTQPEPLCGPPVRHHVAMRTTDRSFTAGLLPRFDASPSPYHAVANVASTLINAGYREIPESDEFPETPGSFLVRRGGSLVAWSTSVDTTSTTGYRIVGAHTDSPNLRVKPQPDTGAAGWRQLGVEIYGGALLNSWLDRDLGLAGRVVVRDGGSTRTLPFTDRRPILRIPQLAIHLDREISERGLLLNRQTHMVPVWAVGDRSSTFVDYLAEAIDVAASDVLSWDAMAFDIAPACVAGLDDDFLVSGRIDNLLSCFVAADALVGVGEGGPHVPMICLFDHEEVGSVSASGAAGTLLESTVARIGAALGGGIDELARAASSSVVVSADGAHATHPNYVDRHEKDHLVAVNGGPVLKINANQRYATDAESAAEFRLVCEDADVPLQEFVSRTDLACGSTIGPLTAGRLGMAVVDVGCPQLAMHSAREMAGSDDPEWFRDALGAFLFR